MMLNRIKFLWRKWFRFSKKIAAIEVEIIMFIFYFMIIGFLSKWRKMRQKSSDKTHTYWLKREIKSVNLEDLHRLS